jgi:glycosyltransferase involved in cell wall biosynthesis
VTATESQSRSTGPVAAGSALVVAVEASRLVHDIRGIGRYVRAMLPRFAAMRPGLRLILLVRRKRDLATMRQMLPGLGLAPDRVEIRLRGEMDRVEADVFWYPWNVTVPAPRRGAVVASMHDVAPIALPDPRWWKFMKNMRWRRRYRATTRRATLLMTISEFSAREIVRTLGYPRERIRVTLLAADDMKVPDASRDAHALARLGVRAPYFLVVGAADRRKNLGLVERAMPRVVETCPNATLVLAGPRRSRSAEEPAWRQTLGYVSDEDLVSLYRSARALIAPSSYEGFGLPLLEAMRLGTPVISVRASSLPEVAGDAAMYVDAEDDVALASAARLVLADDDRHAAMRAAGLAQSTRFSWDETARLTLAVFDEAVALERRGKAGAGAS